MDESKPAAYILAVCGYSRSTMIRQENRDIVLWAFDCKLAEDSHICDVADLASLDDDDDADEPFTDWLGLGTTVSNTIKSIADSVDLPIWNMSVFSSRAYCTTTVWCRDNV